jgi:anti-sigma-K factor RskA
MTKGPDHERWEDAAGSYVLHAMEDEERAGYEAHLETCPACRTEVGELRVAVEALPVSAPPMLPPPALKARIMAEVEREAALLASAAQPTRTEPAARRRRSWRLRVPMPALALACAALIIGSAAGGLLFGGDNGEDSRTIKFATAPSLQDASAELEMGDNGAIIVANGLPPTPAGKVYMVWIQRPGHAPEPTSALFTPRRDGSATASVTGDMEGVENVIVNTEPVGGSTTPTSDPLLTASLS